VASASGTSGPLGASCRMRWALKKQFTPYFTPLSGGRAQCSMRLSSVPSAALDHMSAVPLRGVKLTPRMGKNVSPPSSSGGRSLR